MKPGNILKVKGKISADTVGFSINLGISSRDLALHFNPRFNESVIVCNSKCSDSWGTELRVRHLPFFRGCTVKALMQPRVWSNVQKPFPELFCPNYSWIHAANLSFLSSCQVFIEMLSDKFRVKLPDGHEVCFPNRHSYNITYVSIVGGLKIISFKLT